MSRPVPEVDEWALEQGVQEAFHAACEVGNVKLVRLLCDHFEDYDTFCRESFIRQHLKRLSYGVYDYLVAVEGMYALLRADGTHKNNTKSASHALFRHKLFDRNVVRLVFAFLTDWHA